MKILYFGQLRDLLKLSEESIEIPENVHTVAELVRYLHARGTDWSNVLKEDGSILVAVNQAMAIWKTPVTEGDEIAFFPPVTGG